MEYAGYLTFRGKMSYVCIILGRKPKRLSNRWEDNIKIYLELGCAGINWIYLAQDWNQWQALVNTVSKLSCSITGKELLNFVKD